MKPYLLLAGLALAGASLAQNAGERLEYRHGETVLEGYLAKPEDTSVKRPGILIIHDWSGLDDYEKRRADMLASNGYVVLAVDVYGKGVRPETTEARRAETTKYRQDPDLLVGRLNAALETLRGRAEVDPERIVAMGYCFGGGAALELARSGANITGAASFHGNLNTTRPASAETLKAKVLVMHGAADPAVPQEQVNAFKEEMEKAKADWQLLVYGHAVHSFTEPNAGDDPSDGSAYNELADRRSWEHFRIWLSEIFPVA